MKLFKEILAGILIKEEINVIFPNLEISAAEAVELESFRVLQNIK